MRRYPKTRRQKSPTPKPSYPANLPISERREEIIHALKSHQVIILSGETGSGKTTQIPKMCLEAGRGIKGIIACTQPRRIAALTVASRIAEELGNEKLVGCKIRFHDSTSPENYITVMTDGILLAEAQGKASLAAYDTIIIDEAHERSINIDLLLGIVRRLVDKRPDLKVIITSATLDTGKFSRHFKNAPIIDVSGRSYEVEIRYRNCEEEVSLAEQAKNAVAEILEESVYGDILVFFPGEADIRESMELLSKEYASRYEILPLYARLTAAAQKKVFLSSKKRKVIAATNVAETSLTIPGIRYVVDTGLARISRYNPGSGIQALPVEPVSRASADQRAGRCGRMENGICIRLYSEEDYNSRNQYTAPQILRSNLADVVLRLISAGIPDIENFPFVDPPPATGIRDAVRILYELGALKAPRRRQLSDEGKIMARLPIDPRLSRMLIQADRESSLADVLPIAAALSLPDPRERNPENAARADAAHSQFKNQSSDFIVWLNIWDGFRQSAARGSYSGKLKHYCKEHYLSFRRMKEWMDVHRQLLLIMEEHGYRAHRMKEEVWINRKGEFTQRYAAIHRAILSGLLSHVARREGNGDYEASKKRKLFIHPGSALKKTDAPWIVASEIVRTSRLFARFAAAIDPLWIEDIGAHLIRKNWINPHWNRKSGAVYALEQHRLFEFLVSGDRYVPYGPVRPEETRQIFIQKALVESDIQDISVYPFITKNNQLITQLRETEARLRRRDFLVGEEGFHRFYEDHLPPDVLDLAGLNKALKSDSHLESRLLMKEEDIVIALPPENSMQQFPDTASLSGKTWPLSYVFDMDSREDGVNLAIEAGHISELDTAEADWAIPGLLRDKIEILMRALPKSYRRQLIPIAQHVDEALENITREGSLIHALSQWLYQHKGIDIPLREWKPEALPDHLKLRFKLLDESGQMIASDFDPAKLPGTSADCGSSIQYRKEHERSGIKTWPANLSPSVKTDAGITLWPALQDDGDSVSLRFIENRPDAERIHRKGQMRLAWIHWNREIQNFQKQRDFSEKQFFAAQFFGGAKQVKDALWMRVIHDLFSQKIIHEKSAWDQTLLEGGRKIHATSKAYFDMIDLMLDTLWDVRQHLMDMMKGSYHKVFLENCIKDAENLIASDFIESESPDVWSALPRWLKAMEIRGRKGLEKPSREQRFQEIWNPLSERFKSIRENLSVHTSKEKHAALHRARMMLEELRLSLSAVGEIRPAMKTSEKRVTALLDEIDRMV